MKKLFQNQCQVIVPNQTKVNLIFQDLNLLRTHLLIDLPNLVLDLAHIITPQITTEIKIMIMIMKISQEWIKILEINSGTIITIIEEKWIIQIIILLWEMVAVEIAWRLLAKMANLVYAKYQKRKENFIYQKRDATIVDAKDVILLM